ncbi:hypothetical protein AMELA_G00201150 [Ameiurus melas]|uniref:Uncharacterized protein n=1 Tax=Ameiurus melas TaxID=219545 RepID=A0A7J6A9K2_AMEME|nr:hypothetical protein AMELA_G00201150 [Ameiurus melas]
MDIRRTWQPKRSFPDCCTGTKRTASYWTPYQPEGPSRQGRTARATASGDWRVRRKNSATPTTEEGYKRTPFR